MLLFWPQTKPSCEIWSCVHLCPLSLSHLCASVSQGPQCCTHFRPPGSLWHAGIQFHLGYLGKIVCSGCGPLVWFWGSNSQTTSSPCMDLSLESVCGGDRPSVAIKKWSFSEGSELAVIDIGIADSAQESLLYSWGWKIHSLENRWKTYQLLTRTSLSPQSFSHPSSFTSVTELMWFRMAPIHYFHYLFSPFFLFPWQALFNQQCCWRKLLLWFCTISEWVPHSSERTNATLAKVSPNPWKRHP